MALLLVARAGEKPRFDEVMGGRWSDTYRELKSLYPEASGHPFREVLLGARDAMKARNHVLHAVWTANEDVVTRDGASTGFRNGVVGERHWTIAEIHALAVRVNDLHQATLMEIAAVLDEAVQ